MLKARYANSIASSRIAVLSFVLAFAVSILTALSISVSICAIAAETSAEQLKKFPLDTLEGIGTRISLDTAVKTEGKASFRIECDGPVTFTLASMKGPDVEEAKLVYSAKVKTEIEGLAFLEMWVWVNGVKFFSRGIATPISGTTEWTRLEIPFLLKKGEKPEKVSLAIVIQGTGKVWIDELALEKLPL